MKTKNKDIWVVVNFAFLADRADYAELGTNTFLSDICGISEK